LKLEHELLDLTGRDGVESRAGLVHQQDVGLGGNRPGDAQPLLLAARQRQSALVQLVLDRFPECGTLQCLLYTFLDIALVAVQAQPEGDVVVDTHREGIRLLEDHADVTANHHRVDRLPVDVLSVIFDVSLEPEARNEIVHPIQAAQHRALAAAGRADETGDLALLDRDVAVAHGEKIAVEDLLQLAVDHRVADRGKGRCPG
jgi:hypothetical protein